MRNNIVHLLFLIFALVLGAVFEELLPKYAGVGFPVLLVVVQTFSARPMVIPAIVVALLAGGLEDALSGLPVMMSVSFFLGVSLTTHFLRESRWVTALTYSAYQVWLSLWVVDLQGSFYLRFLLALPIGLVTGWIMGMLLEFFARRAAIRDESESE